MYTSTNPSINDTIGTLGIVWLGFFIFRLQELRREVAVVKRILAEIENEIHKLQHIPSNRSYNILTSIESTRKEFVKSLTVKKIQMRFSIIAIFFVCISMPIVDSITAPILVLGVTICKINRFISRQRMMNTSPANSYRKA